MDRIMRRRRRSYTTQWNRLLLLACTVMVLISNVILTVYYMMNPTVKISSSYKPILFIIVSLIIKIMLLSIIALIYLGLYNSRFADATVVLCASLIIIKTVFASFVVISLVNQTDNFLDEVDKVSIDSNTLANSYKSMYGCCFNVTFSTILQKAVVNETISVANSTQLQHSTKAQQTEGMKNTCPDCDRFIREYVRHVAVLISTGYVFNIITLSAIILLVIHYYQNL